MYVSIAIVRMLVAELHRQGVDEGRFLAIAGLERADLVDPARMIAVGRYDEIVRCARGASADPDLGLHVGESAPAGGAHVVGHILHNSSSVREAFALFIRYAPLVAEGVRLSLREDGGAAAAVYAHPDIAPDNTRYDVEAALALILGIGKRLLRPGSGPHQVCFAYPCPPSIAEHRRIFGCELVFDAPQNEIRFDRSLLDLSQDYRDERVCEWLRSCAEEMLTRRRADDQLPERVRELLRYAAELDGAEADRIGRRLGMSARSLQRGLRERGVSFSALLDEARKAIACQALACPDYPIKDLAARLGFSEPSAFHRAFRRWMGITPAEFRRRAIGNDRDP